MLSKTTLKLMHIATEMQYYHGGGPFKWIKPTNRIRFVTSKFHYGLCVLTFLVSATYEMFLLYRLMQFQLVKGDDYSLSAVIQLAYNAASYMMPVIIQIQNFLFWDEMSAFINSYINFYEHFKVKYLLANVKVPRNGCEKTMKTIFIVGNLIILQNVILILRQPQRPYFVTSMLDDPKSAPLLHKLPIIIYHFWVWIACWSQLFFYCFHMFAFPYVGIFIIREMSANRVSHLTSKDIRSAKVFPSLYRTMQLLQVLFNFHFRWWLFPSHKTVMMVLACVSTYGAIKITGPRGIIMGTTATGCLLYLSVLFRKLGQYDEISINTLASWRGKSHYLSNFVKSSQPIKVYIGPYYSVTKTTVLVLWSTVINFTITLLLE